jgi:D-alanine-D-alanine ligase
MSLNHPDSPRHVAVFHGGFSGEREVSLRSGKAVIEALRSEGLDVTPVDIVDRSWTLPDGVDVVFLALHGGYGEDGSIQFELEQRGIPFTGCDSRSSAIAFDKSRSKPFFEKAGLCVPRGGVLDSPDSSLPESMSFPVVIKPVADGSSLGLEFVDEASHWPDALRRSLAAAPAVLVEERIIGPEYTVGILEGWTLPLIEIIPAAGGYNYQNKYTQGGATHVLHQLSANPRFNLIHQAGQKAFDALGCRHYGRVDVIDCPHRGPVVLEVNTLPGMTELSLFPEAAQGAGLGFSALCLHMVSLAWNASTQQNS